MKLLTPLLTALLLASPALADDTKPPLSRLETHLDFSLDYAFRTDIDGPGTVAVTRANADIESAWHLMDKVTGTLFLGTEWTWYNFSGATAVLPGPPVTGSPFNQMVDTSFRPGVIYAMTEHWSLVAGGILEISGQLGADTGDSLRGGGYLGVRKQQNKNLAWTLGITAESRLDDSFQFLPLLGLEWHVSDTVVVTLQGPAVRVSSKLNDQWSFVLDAAFQSREFRLDTSSPLSGGVIRDTRVPVAAGFIWRPDHDWEVTLKAGAVVYQEYKLLNSSGVIVNTLNSDMTPFVYLGGTWHF
jgi:hypothetical protein